MIVNNPLDPLPFMSGLGHAHRELLTQGRDVTLRAGRWNGKPHSDTFLVLEIQAVCQSVCHSVRFCDII